MNSDILYSLRFTNLLALPKVVSDVISAMHLAPVAPVYIRKSFKKFIKKTASTDDNWRRELITEIKATIRTKDDADYEAVIGIVNRVVASNVNEKSSAILEILKKRDDKFRLRVVNLLFNRGVSMIFYAKVVADIFVFLAEHVPLIRDDLQIFCSQETFNKLFDQSLTYAFPDRDDPNFEDNVCTWSKQRELRRGFAVFSTELYIRGLIAEELIHDAITTATTGLEENVQKPADKLLIEAIDQIVVFMSELSKLLGTNKILHERAQEIISIPREKTPCLGMRSRFKLEECVHKK